MKKILFTSILLTCLTTFSLRTRAGNDWRITPFQRKAFIENKGQFNANLPQEYQDFTYCIDNNSRVLFSQSGLTFVVKKIHHKKLGPLAIFMSEEKREKLERQAGLEIQYINMKWLNANPNAEMEVSQQQVTSYNYLMFPKGGKPFTEMCKGFSKLTYKNLYPGIDVEYFFTEKEGFKYNLIVSAGADMSKVQMQYDKDAKVVLQGGDIIVKTLKGELIDHQPVSYLTENTSEPITSSFSLKNNLVSFVLNNPENKAITIDPWVITPGLGGNPAYDNGVDGSGSVYLYGANSASGNVCEKYAPAGTPLLWTLTNGETDTWGGYYYGDLLVQATGDFYLSSASSSGASVFKFNTNSGLTWQSTNSSTYQEHWRMAINCITNEVIVAGGGTTSPTSNIAQVNISTGVLSNIISFSASRDDQSGLCVDALGKSYTHGANSNTLYFTNNTNNPVGTVPSGYNFAELSIVPTSVPTYYSMDSFGEALGNGYNMMALGGTTFLFTSDGATLKKWDRNTYALLGSAAIPGGSQHMAGGILADVCGNVFVGSTTGIYRYDSNLNIQEFHATSAAVYDIAFSPTSADIIACGSNFAADIPFGRLSCGTLQTVLNINPCNPGINSVAIHPVVSNSSIPPFTFLWDDGNTDSTRTNLSPGKHVVVVKSGGGCVPEFTIDTIKIAANTSSAMVAIKKPSCFGGATGSLQVNISGGQHILSYSVSPTSSSSLLNDSTIKATGLAAGTYTFAIQSSAGCTLDSVMTVVSAPALTYTVTHGTLVCYGDTTSASIAISGGTGIKTVTWTSPSGTGVSVHGIGAGSYAGSIIDSLGCTATFSTTLTQPAKPIVTATSSTICLGQQTATLTASGVNTYTWSPSVSLSSSTGSPVTGTPTVTTNYTVTGSDASGCINTATTQVMVYALPTVLANSATICVSEQTATLTANGASTYAWSPSTGLSALTGSLITGTPNATTNYTVTGTDAHGCINTATTSITVNSLPTPTASANTPCETEQALTLTCTPVGTYTYSWSGPNTFTSSVQSPSITNLNQVTMSASGIYSVTVTDINGCYAQTMVTVTINPKPVITASGATVCAGAQINLSSSGAGAGGSYSWNGTAGFNSALQNPILTNGTTAMNGMYNVIGTDVNGCYSSEAVQVQVNTLPIINIASSGSICVGEQTATLTATSSNSGTTYTWVPGTYLNHPSGNQVIANPTITGTFSYTATGTDDNGCVGTQTISVLVNPLPVLAVNSSSICLGQQTATLSASGANTYTWKPTTGLSDANSASVSASPNSSTTYSVIGVDMNGCVNYTTAVVLVNPLPIADFVYSPNSVSVLDPNVLFHNQSTGNINQYNWTFGDIYNLANDSSAEPNPSHNYLNIGSYNVTLMVKTPQGCYAQITKPLIVQDVYTLYVPNAFTPNGDGLNDIFTAVGEGINTFSLDVFDRWGLLIYHSNDITKGWDGTYGEKNTQILQEDVYVWKIDATDVITNQNHTLQGTVTLVR
ncbi:MAG: gliding motility-associated C-terminal domain-containing protein [Bacteroidetes bacterium]|nr:gliding motility-associated C-terminal domain-containing protein [Bacteroidota bacterium]